MNNVVSNQQQKDYERFVSIEQLFDTQLMGNFVDCEIYSTDIFQTRNLLAVHDSYWNEYADEFNGLHLNVINGENKNAISLLYDDEKFTISNGE